MKDKNRCLSASPGLGWRCQFRKGHPGRHQAAFARWSSAEGSTWTGPQEKLGNTASTVIVDEAYSIPPDALINRDLLPGRSDGGPGSLFGPQAAGLKFGFDTTPLRTGTSQVNLGGIDLGGMGRAFLNHMRAGFAAQDQAEAEMHSMCTEPCGPTCGVEESPEQELTDWWINQAGAETDMVVAKAIEYGATDLRDLGQMLARTMKREVSDEEAAELGVFFYLLGKVSRWQSAIERGDRPSADTLLDIGVYVRMAQRIRHSGSWPGSRPAETTP